MDIQKILEKVQKDPKLFTEMVAAVKENKLSQKLKEKGFDVAPEKVAELSKKLLANGGAALNDLKNNKDVQAALDKGSDLLKGLLKK